MFRVSILSAALLASLALPSRAAELTIEVIGANPARGQFLISVFDRPETWMKHPVATRAPTVAADGAGAAKFSLPAGSYAIALIHDANGNGKTDTNAFGIPTEAFGFSNGARAHFGPPAFGKSAFTLTEPGGRLTISLDRAKR